MLFSLHTHKEASLNTRYLIHVYSIPAHTVTIIELSFNYTFTQTSLTTQLLLTSCASHVSQQRHSPTPFTRCLFILAPIHNLCPPHSTSHLFLYCPSNLVPRPSHHPVLDRKQIHFRAGILCLEQGEVCFSLCECSKLQ